LKLLLDTHIWLWSLAQPSRLSRRVQHEIRDGQNELWLSPVSTWEALLLHAKRRIHLDGAIRDWMAKATMHMREAPLTHEIVVVAQELPLEHPDPADRAWPDARDRRPSTVGLGEDRHPGKPLSAVYSRQQGSKTSFGEIVQLAKARRVDTVKGLGPPLNSWIGLD
jgi:PIN domain nuclease of toxin-antitoxin system